MEISDGTVVKFGEKLQSDEGWINGGFFCVNKNIKEYLSDNPEEPWESTPLENLAKDNELSAYKHYGFWQPMDTLREKEVLENLWRSGQAPWVV